MTTKQTPNKLSSALSNTRLSKPTNPQNPINVGSGQMVHVGSMVASMRSYPHWGDRYLSVWRFGDRLFVLDSYRVKQVRKAPYYNTLRVIEKYDFFAGMGENRKNRLIEKFGRATIANPTSVSSMASSQNTVVAKTAEPPMFAIAGGFYKPEELSLLDAVMKTATDSRRFRTLLKSVVATLAV